MFVPTSFARPLPPATTYTEEIAHAPRSSTIPGLTQFIVPDVSPNPSHGGRISCPLPTHPGPARRRTIAAQAPAEDVARAQVYQHLDDCRRGALETEDALESVLELLVYWRCGGGREDSRRRFRDARHWRRVHSIEWPLRRATRSAVIKCTRRWHCTRETCCGFARVVIGPTNVPPRIQRRQLPPPAQRRAK